MRPSLNGSDCLTSAHHFEGALPSTWTEGTRWILSRARRNAARRDEAQRPAKPVARRASGARATAFGKVIGPAVTCACRSCD